MFAGWLKIKARYSDITQVAPSELFLVALVKKFDLPISNATSWEHLLPAGSIWNWKIKLFPVLNAHYCGRSDTTGGCSDAIGGRSDTVCGFTQ